MSRRRLGLLIAGALVVAIVVVIAWVSLGSLQLDRGELQPTPRPVTSGACHSVNGLPDRICTPGVADPRVTQDNMQATICVSGYTTKVRPSSRYTDDLKVVQINAYGYSDTSVADYEEDHLIPLELGGHPTDPKNLWPEPRSGAYPAAKKDGVENSLHANVCAGQMTLAAAQAAIASDWESVR